MISTNRLKAFDFFKGFTDAQVEQLAAIAKEDSFASGAQMYRQGDEARALFFLEEGKAILTMESQLGPHKPPLQVTVDVITKGESMGWSAVVPPYHFTLAALCIDAIKAVALDAPSLRKLMDADPALGYAIMKSTAQVISQRLTHTRIILVGERGLSQLTEY